MLLKKVLALLTAAVLMLSSTAALAQAVDSAPKTGVETLEDKLDKMLPALDSIARAMGVDGEVGYAPSNSEFFWTVMYLMGQNWGYTHAQYTPIEAEYETLVSLPRAAIQEMASAAFYDFNDLCELYDTTIISYDEESDSYVFAPSDIGDTFTRITNCSRLENGNLNVTLGMFDGMESQIGRFEFTLTDNPWTQYMERPAYSFSVLSAAAVPLK